MDGCSPFFLTLDWPQDDISEVGCVENGQLRRLFNWWQFQLGGFTVQALSVTWLPGLQVKNIIMGAAVPLLIIIIIISIIISTVLNILPVLMSSNVIRSVIIFAHPHQRRNLRQCWGYLCRTTRKCCDFRHLFSIESGTCSNSNTRNLRKPKAKYENCGHIFEEDFVQRAFGTWTCPAE